MCWQLDACCNLTLESPLFDACLTPQAHCLQHLSHFLSALLHICLLLLWDRISPCSPHLFTPTLAVVRSLSHQSYLLAFVYIRKYSGVVEAHCYVVNIGQTDRGQMRSWINNNWCRTFRPCRPLSTACKAFCRQLTKAYAAKMSCIICYWFCYLSAYHQFAQ